MIIVSVPTDNIIDEDGAMTVPWGNFFDQNTQQMQQSIGNEGFWIPTVSSASDSVNPPATGGQLAQVAASFGKQTGVNAGTIVFDPAAGAAGQLKVILNDGVFHPITTT